MTTFKQIPARNVTYVAMSVVLYSFVSGCMPVVEQDGTGGLESGTAPRVSASPERVAVESLSNDGALLMDDFKGRVVLVDFWATWSAPSRHELPELASLHAELEGKGFTVVGLCMDGEPPDQVRQRIEALGLPYPVGRADEAALNAYGGVRVVPTKVLLDRDGKIRNTYEGVASIDELRADILRLLGN